VVVVILKVQKYIIDIRGDDTYFENPQKFDILPPKGSKSRWIFKKALF